MGCRLLVAQPHPPAKVHTTFYPLGYFEPNQSALGTLNLYGDVEYRGAGLI